MDNVNNWIQFSAERAPIKLRLICFHHAGGSANFFQNWASQLPDYVQVCAVQLPGRWDRVHEKAFTDMEALVPELYEALKDLHTKPIAILGYSFGARVAFEYVRSLRKNKVQLPIAFFSLASKAPSSPRGGQTLHTLTEQELIKCISDEYGPFPEIVLQDDELRALLVGILRADMQILETYKFRDEPAFHFPIVALGGLSDRMVDADGLADWRKLTAHDFSMRIYEGGHFFAETMQEEVRDCLRHHINRYAAKIL